MPYINQGNLPIHYHVKGSGPALVQLHGFTGSLVDFNLEPYLQLAENYTLIQIDLRGHGLSMKSHDPDDYQIKYFVDDLAAILDKEVLIRPMLWVFHWEAFFVTLSTNI